MAIPSRYTPALLPALLVLLVPGILLAANGKEVAADGARGGAADGGHCEEGDDRTCQMLDDGEGGEPRAPTTGPDIAMTELLQQLKDSTDRIRTMMDARQKLVQRISLQDPKLLNKLESSSQSKSTYFLLPGELSAIERRSQTDENCDCSQQGWGKGGGENGSPGQRRRATLDKYRRDRKGGPPHHRKFDEIDELEPLQGVNVTALAISKIQLPHNRKIPRDMRTSLVAVHLLISAHHVCKEEGGTTDKNASCNALLQIRLLRSREVLCEFVVETATASGRIDKLILDTTTRRLLAVVTDGDEDGEEKVSSSSSSSSNSNSSGEDQTTTPPTPSTLLLSFSLNAWTQVVGNDDAQAHGEDKEGGGGGGGGGGAREREGEGGGVVVKIRAELIQEARSSIALAAAGVAASPASPEVSSEGKTTTDMRIVGGLALYQLNRKPLHVLGHQSGLLTTWTANLTQTGAQSVQGKSLYRISTLYDRTFVYATDEGYGFARVLAKSVQLGVFCPYDELTTRFGDPVRGKWPNGRVVGLVRRATFPKRMFLVDNGGSIVEVVADKNRQGVLCQVMRGIETLSSSSREEKKIQVAAVSSAFNMMIVASGAGKIFAFNISSVLRPLSLIRELKSIEGGEREHDDEDRKQIIAVGLTDRQIQYVACAEQLPSSSSSSAPSLSVVHIFEAKGSKSSRQNSPLPFHKVPLLFISIIGVVVYQAFCKGRKRAKPPPEDIIKKLQAMRQFGLKGGMGNGSSASSQFLSTEDLKILNQLKRDAGRFRSSRSSYGGGVYDKDDYGDFEYE